VRIPPISVLLSGILLLPACREAQLTSTQNASLEKWLNCDECLAGERDAVKGMGNEAVPRLRELLLGYPDSAELRVFMAQARTAYRMSPPVGITEEEYRANRFGVFQARRQTRAALSLVDIHTAPAKSVIDYASRIALGRFRSDVARAVRFQAATWDGLTFSDTALRDVQFGDSVTLQGTTTSLTALALAVIDSSPFPPDSIILHREAGKLIFAAAGLPGPHGVAVIDGGSTRMTHLTITSDVDPNDRHTRLCTTDQCRADSADVITAASLPALKFLTLKSTGTALDTMDFFRIQAPPGGPLNVIARLDWRGQGSEPVNLDLRWANCVGLGLTGSGSGATPLNRPEVTSILIPPGQCRLLLVIGPRALGVPTVIARLRIASP
jgi:hypothetical protein